MWKKVLVGTAALAIVGTSFVYAQQGPGGPGFMHRGFMHQGGWQPSADDVAAFSDARIAALHAGLKLTADQEKNWPPVEAALREMAKQRIARIAARASADVPKDPIQRLQLRADLMTQRGAALKKLADAAGPLYQSLDDGQKHRFALLARMERQHFGRGEGGRPGMRGRMMQRGPGGPGGRDGFGDDDVK